MQDLYDCSKKGENIWLSMATKSSDTQRFPLLHLKCRSFIEGKVPRPHTLRDGTEVFEKDIIYDSFYHYKIRIPNITPKDAKFLELIPSSWEVYDLHCRSLYLSRDYAGFNH